MLKFIKSDLKNGLWVLFKNNVYGKINETKGLIEVKTKHFNRFKMLDDFNCDLSYSYDLRYDVKKIFNKKPYGFLNNISPAIMLIEFDYSYSLNEMEILITLKRQGYKILWQEDGILYTSKQKPQMNKSLDGLLNPNWFEENIGDLVYSIIDVDITSFLQAPEKRYNSFMDIGGCLSRSTY